MASDSQLTCPFCDSVQIETVQGNKSICQDCNFVITDDGESIETDFITESLDSSSGTEQAAQKEWSETVTAVDSSESALIEMIETSEERVQSLNGETDACIRAAELLTDAWEQQYFRGRSVNHGIAAVVYTTFRQLEQPRPLSIVADACDITEQQLRTGYQALGKVCQLESPLVSTVSYIPFLSTQLGTPKEAERDAKRLAESASEMTGSPVSIAAACMYHVSQSHSQRVTLADAGDAAGIAKETVWLKNQDLSNDHQPDI
mgnify:CR=1 FL=1